MEGCQPASYMYIAPLLCVGSPHDENGSEIQRQFPPLCGWCDVPLARRFPRNLIGLGEAILYSDLTPTMEGSVPCTWALLIGVSG